MKILITGATGFVGRHLVEKLIASNHEIAILTRNTDSAKKLFSTNQDKISFHTWTNNLETPPNDAFNAINGIINLMGENIGDKRWSDDQKNKLKTSRVDTTLNLVKKVKELNLNLDFFINASAIGIYPTNLAESLDENSNVGNSYLSHLCLDWENALTNSNLKTRKVLMRTGVVLDKNFGAMKKMLPPFYLGAGGILGDGKQMMSWIHIDDLVNLYLEAVKNPEFVGPINACSNYPVSNYTFTKALGSAIHRPTIFPVPAMAIKLLFGEMSTIILDSQKITSIKLNKLGFNFKYPKIEDAFKAIFN